MKVHIIVMVILLTTYGTSAKSMKDIRNLWKAAAMPALEHCTSQALVDPRVVEEFFEHGRMPNDPAWKCYLKCVGLELGTLSPTGEINAQKAVEIFKHVDVALVEKCDPKDEPDLCEKTFQALNCGLNELSSQYLSE
ncbi:hypothetical protein ILUMI_09159 [Ignelater luminosus]|uniref:Uncharacterized protein n=1 Tax=Ignelater luminosus TaxID=2038154 RepID=A0A8K0GFB3_IGNLU|nr:hypothetical protein ILUMI_09159 [Ignelater luminosus]